MAPIPYGGIGNSVSCRPADDVRKCLPGFGRGELTAAFLQMAQLPDAAVLLAHAVKAFRVQGARLTNPGREKLLSVGYNPLRAWLFGRKASGADRTQALVGGLPA